MVQEGTAELNKVSPKVSDNSIPTTELGGISPTPTPQQTPRLCRKRRGRTSLSLWCGIQSHPLPKIPHNGRKGHGPRGNWVQQAWVALIHCSSLDKASLPLCNQASPSTAQGYRQPLEATTVKEAESLLCVCAHSVMSLCDPMDCSPPGSSVHGIFQA